MLRCVVKREYVLITPVYNEEELVGRVIESVIAQTITPKKWLIVDDDSTDRTGDIIKKYEREYDFIEYYPVQRTGIQNYYSRRTEVFLMGFEKLKQMEFDFLAALDADLSMEPTYYESILREFDQNPKLGIASGVYINYVNGHLQKIVRDHISTPGGLQMFNRTCYESIGGYKPLKYGGDDSLMDIRARMKGWQTRSFPQYTAIHWRPIGSRLVNNVLMAKFKQGFAEYCLGTHPIFMLAKSLRRIFIERPYFFGSIARLSGYFYSCLKRGEREIPDAVLNFVRKEQMRRLFNLGNY